MNPIEPKSRERHPEWAAQQAALRAVNDGAEGAERDYRKIYAGIAAAPMPTLPADFAVRVLARIDDLAESATTERWLLWLLGLAMVVGSVLFAGPELVDAFAPITHRIESPWPMMAAAVLCGVVLLDHAAGWRKRWRA